MSVKSCCSRQVRPVVDEWSHLLGEGGRRVGTGEDEVDLAEHVLDRATALVLVVHEVVGVEGGTRRDPGGEVPVMGEP